MEIRRLGPQIGAEVLDVDVRDLGADQFDAIYRTWLDCNVLAVRDQELEIDEFLTYSLRFGTIHPHPSKNTRHPDHPEITFLGIDKFRPDGSLDDTVYRRGGHGWHTDGAYDSTLR